MELGTGIIISIGTFLSGIVFGMIIGGYIDVKEIKKSLLKTNKFRLDDYYVINGSVDKELK